MAEKIRTPTHQKLSCPLCFEVFEKATVLNCGHTFCQTCLKEYDRTNKDMDHMVCPLCRNLTQLGKRRVDGLPANVAIDRVVQAAQDIALGGRCTMCLGDDLPSIAFCGDCGMFLCHTCYAGHERMRALFQNHLVVSMWDVRGILNAPRSRSGTAQANTPGAPHQGKGLRGGDQCSSSTESPKKCRVIKAVDLDEEMESMVLMLDNTFVVGYAQKPVADMYSASGVRTGHLKLGIDRAQSVAFMKDGRSVISHGKNMNIIRIFSAEGAPTPTQFRCPKGSSNCQVCVDHDDAIYAVNGNSEIYVFREGSEVPRKVIGTPELHPRQIFANIRGTIVVSSCFMTPSRVNVYDADGNLGSALKATQEDEFLYPALLGSDGLFLARVNFFSETVQLSTYSLEGAILTQTGHCSALKLPEVRSPWCKLVGLSGNTLAFGSHKKIYFLELV